MDEKREPLLCPFRKRTIYRPGCDSQYRESFELASSYEEFLPCLQDKCSAWAGGRWVTCMIPQWKMPEV